MNQIEYRIHKACVDYLEQRVWQGNKLVSKGNPAFENLLFFHVPNQQHGNDSASTGFFLKQMGVLPGAYDFLFFWHGRGAAAFDVKAPNDGSLSTAQKKFRERFERCGFPTGWGTSVASLRDALIGWGAKCVNPHVREPDLRTDTQKKSDAFAFYARPQKD